MTNVAKFDRQELATVSENAAMVSMFERMASDPNVDVDKLERLMQMRERAIERQAKEQFDAAMSELQPDLPSIGERGNAAGRYTYALWEDINTAIKPILMRHGFALTFRTDFANGITVTGVLSHRGGHREETSITLPADKSGNKNDVQAVASSVSYGKRYTAGALLNLTSHGEDDDAYRAGNGPSVESHEWIKKASDCNSPEELQEIWKTGGDALRKAGDREGYSLLKRAVTDRLDYIKNSPTDVENDS